MRLSSVGLLVSALLSWTLGAGQPVAAQADLFEAGELWVGTVLWTGQQADVLKPGWRTMAAGSVEIEEGRLLVVEAHYGRFSPRVEGTTVAEAGVRLAGRVLLEPRQDWRPYLQARIGIHALLGTGDASGARQVGFLLGPEAGVMYRLDERVSLMGAFEGAWVWYGDVAGTNPTAEDSGGYSLHFGLRTGVRLLLDPRR